MDSVSVSELRQQTSRVLRRVWERRETVKITLRGRVVALLVPAPQPAVAEGETPDAWRDLEQLAAEIRARRPAGISAVEAVRDVRRDL